MGKIEIIETRQSAARCVTVERAIRFIEIYKIFIENIQIHSLY
jgi:hypothetical protein